MTQTTKDRVLARLAALGIGPTSNEIKRRLQNEGLSPVYLSELVSGKKAQLRVSKLDAVARALECSAEYLMGQSDLSHAGAILDGICSAGIWRDPRPKFTHSIGVEPHPDFPWNRQSVFIVSGEYYKKFDIEDATLLLALSEAKLSPGDKVVARFSRDDDDFQETTILAFKGDDTWLKVESGTMTAVSGGFQLIGKIVKTHAAF